MKDFDFDELDRAVNSVLAKKEPSDGSASDTQTDTNTVPPTADTSVPVVVDDSNSSQDTTSNTSDTEDAGSPIAVSVSNSSDSSEEEHLAETTQEDDSSDQDTEEVSHDESSENSEEQTDLQPIEPSSDVTEESEEDEFEQKTESNGEQTTEESAEPLSVDETSATSLASIPVKRGRFMDVMTPQNGDANKPLAPRGGVKLTPSSDFSSSLSSEPSQPEEPVAIDEAQVVAVESTSESTTDMPSNVSDDASSEKDLSSVSGEDNGTTAEETSLEQSDATPFIPDVPVEKRPLNSLTPDSADTTHEESQFEPTEPVSDQVSVDPTLTANVPKEFDKDIMAVEANETVGESDETHAATTEPPTAPTETQASDATNTLAMAATTAEPHPMFDTSTLGHAGTATHHSSKLTWTVVVASLFIVGAALGVLYFLYGQA